MKRSGLGLDDIADWRNLTAAFHRAAQGKGDRDEVQRFRADLFGELARLRAALLDGSVEVGRLRCFHIRDPKPRVIHAPCFRERVLHHALMAHVGPVLDRALVADTYACRVGKGTLAAVQRVQHHLRRFPWYAQIDIRAYFATIDHQVLLARLERRFKDRGLLALFARIIAAHHTEPGKGLPIGALTSQHFANYYLAGLDRLLLESCRVRGLARYMDDLVWWGDEKAAVCDALDQACAYAQDPLQLTVKTTGPGRGELRRPAVLRLSHPAGSTVALAPAQTPLRRAPPCLGKRLGRGSDRRPNASGRVCRRPGHHRARGCRRVAAGTVAPPPS